jgi:hypothetical protein
MYVFIKIENIKHYFVTLVLILLNARQVLIFYHVLLFYLTLFMATTASKIVFQKLHVLLTIMVNVYCKNNFLTFIALFLWNYYTYYLIYMKHIIIHNIHYSEQSISYKYQYIFKVICL